MELSTLELEGYNLSQIAQMNVDTKFNLRRTARLA